MILGVASAFAVIAQATVTNYSAVRVSYKVKILIYTITEPQLFADSQCRGLLRCKSSNSGRAEALRVH